jgi:AcrR family transcriptional regulator
MSSFEGPTPEVRAREGRHPVRVQPRRRRTQAERSDEMRSRLIEATLVVLRRKGYAGLRTEEVARVARVSRGAMQHHFALKESLVLAAARHLLQNAFERGRVRAEAARGSSNLIDAIIDDCLDFFLGSDFATVLDLVIAGSKDRGLRDEIYSSTRDSRLGIEAAWLDLLCEQGLPRDRAEVVLWLTIDIVRGFAVRALWQRDEALFKRLLGEWKAMLAVHLKGLQETSA